MWAKSIHNFNGQRMTDIGIYDVNYLDLDLYFQSLTFTGKERLTLTFTALAKLFRSLSVLSIIDIDTCWERKTAIDIYNSIKQCC